MENLINEEDIKIREELNKYKNVLDKCKWVHRAIDNGNYLKIYTNILLGKSNDYLNLYLIPEDNGDMYMSDSNNIYAVLDYYYVVSQKMLQDLCNKACLEFIDFRIVKKVNINNVCECFEDFNQVVNGIIKQK